MSFQLWSVFFLLRKILWHASYDWFKSFQLDFVKTPEWYARPALVCIWDDQPTVGKPFDQAGHPARLQLRRVLAHPPDGRRSSCHQHFAHRRDCRQRALQQFIIPVHGVSALRRFSEHPTPGVRHDKLLKPAYRPQYLHGSCAYSSEWYRASDGKHNATLVATAASVLPPMLNALEIYTLIDLDDAPSTFPKDCEFSIGSLLSNK